jgi:two-component system response regulator GlrR
MSPFSFNKDKAGVQVVESESTSKPILIVDDEAKLRFTMTVILRRAGYSVMCVETGVDALKGLQTCRFSLMFLDIRLPDIDGLKVLAQARQRYPELPVVVLTGDDSLETTLRSLRLGARGYLLKPVRPDQILYCVDQIMNERPKIFRKRGITSRKKATQA